MVTSQMCSVENDRIYEIFASHRRHVEFFLQVQSYALWWSNYIAQYPSQLCAWSYLWEAKLPKPISVLKLFLWLFASSCWMLVSYFRKPHGFYRFLMGSWNYEMRCHTNIGVVSNMDRPHFQMSRGGFAWWWCGFVYRTDTTCFMNYLRPLFVTHIYWDLAV